MNMEIGKWNKKKEKRKERALPAPRPKTSDQPISLFPLKRAPPTLHLHWSRHCAGTWGQPVSRTSVTSTRDPVSQPLPFSPLSHFMWTSSCQVGVSRTSRVPWPDSSQCLCPTQQTTMSRISPCQLDPREVSWESDPLLRIKTDSTVTFPCALLH